MSAVFAFAVTVVGQPDWGQTVNARSRGAAKAKYFRDVLDSWPDLPWTLLRCRKVGSPVSTKQFVRNAEYRGLPELRCGQRVAVGDERGTVVGHDASANIRVLFDATSKYRGAEMSVHPDEMEVCDG